MIDTGGCDVLVLDEILGLIDLDILTVEDIIHLIELRDDYTRLVLTGQNLPEDIELNVCKTKHLTNTRSSSADDALKLVPPKKLSLEEALEFIDTDELLEITPTSLRIRKKILDSTLRFRSKKNAQNN